MHEDIDVIKVLVGKCDIQRVLQLRYFEPSYTDHRLLEQIICENKFSIFYFYIGTVNIEKAIGIVL